MYSRRLYYSSSVLNDRLSESLYTFNDTSKEKAKCSLMYNRIYSLYLLASLICELCYFVWYYTKKYIYIRICIYTCAFVYLRVSGRLYIDEILEPREMCFRVTVESTTDIFLMHKKLFISKCKTNYNRRWPILIRLNIKPIAIKQIYFVKIFWNDILFKTRTVADLSHMVPELNHRGILKQFLQK